MCLLVSQMQSKHVTCQHHHPEEPWQPLQPTPATEYLRQHLGTNLHCNGSEYLITTDYHSKMPIICRISNIPMQCFNDNIYHEGVICRTWDSKIPTHWQWPTIHKCPICWVSHSMEMWPQQVQWGIPKVLAKQKLPWRSKDFLPMHPYLLLLAYCRTPTTAYLCSPAELLYQ